MSTVAGRDPVRTRRPSEERRPGGHTLLAVGRPAERRHDVALGDHPGECPVVPDDRDEVVAGARGHRHRVHEVLLRDGGHESRD